MRDWVSKAVMDGVIVKIGNTGIVLLPPFLKAFGRKRTPVPTKAFPSKKLAFNAETFPWAEGISSEAMQSSSRI